MFVLATGPGTRFTPRTRFVGNSKTARGRISKLNLIQHHNLSYTSLVWENLAKIMSGTKKLQLRVCKLYSGLTRILKITKNVLLKNVELIIILTWLSPVLKNMPSAIKKTFISALFIKTSHNAVEISNLQPVRFPPFCNFICVLITSTLKSFAQMKSDCSKEDIISQSLLRL